MPEWSSGYVADVGYTYGYYQELNPLRTALLSLHAGIAPSEITTACELGFGQGLSLNIHAAASDVDWSGTDFNPSHAAFARKLAELSGSGARLFDDAFADFARRDDIPDFDYIALHGIWSWISDENRAVIVDFVKRKLKVGGILYISYNTIARMGRFRSVAPSDDGARRDDGFGRRRDSEPDKRRARVRREAYGTESAIQPGKPSGGRAAQEDEGA